MWRSPSRAITVGAASPVPWAYGDNSWISLGPGEEVLRVLRAHFIIAVVVTDISSVWVVIHMRTESAWDEHHLLRVREIRVYVALVPRFHFRLRPPSHFSIHVIQVDAEPIDRLWDGEVGNGLFRSVVPPSTRAVEERSFIGPYNCGTPWERSTHSARILDVVLPRQSSRSELFGQLQVAQRVKGDCVCCTYSWSHTAPHQLITQTESDNCLVGQEVFQLWHCWFPLRNYTAPRVPEQRGSFE